MILKQNNPLYFEIVYMPSFNAGGKIWAIWFWSIFPIIPWTSIDTKLMGLGLTNRIVDNSDFKLVDFDCWFPSDSKSNDESESTIAI